MSGFWSMFRSMRNDDLRFCDWTQLPDAQLSPEDKEAWTTYRQQLRDLPDTVTDPLPYVSIPKPNWLWPCAPGQVPVPNPADYVSNVEAFSSVDAFSNVETVSNVSNVDAFSNVETLTPESPLVSQEPVGVDAPPSEPQSEEALASHTEPLDTLDQTDSEHQTELVSQPLEVPA